jgi:hypothetical protein
VGRERLRRGICAALGQAAPALGVADVPAASDGVLRKTAVELNQVDREGTIDTLAAARIVTHPMGFWQRPSIITR